MFATADQTAMTIAQLLVEVISRHGVLPELLSGRGSAFLSGLMEVYHLIQIHRTNTMGYHPQTDGLVKWPNQTLTDMLAKLVEKTEGIVTYTMSCLPIEPVDKKSTQESPFFHMYSCDPYKSKLH